MIHGLFQAVSIATTTGFTTADYANWPAAVPVAADIRELYRRLCRLDCGRHQGYSLVCLIYKQGVREIARLVHPSAEIPVKLGTKAVQSRVVDAVWGFFSVYIVVFGVMMMAMMRPGWTRSRHSRP